MRRLSGALVQEVKERIELGHKQTMRGQGGCYAVKRLEMAELVLETSQPPFEEASDGSCCRLDGNRISAEATSLRFFSSVGAWFTCSPLLLAMCSPPLSL